MWWDHIGKQGRLPCKDGWIEFAFYSELWAAYKDWSIIKYEACDIETQKSFSRQFRKVIGPSKSIVKKTRGVPQRAVYLGTLDYWL